jgi:Holliday junction resolvase RusA-like endonuclease
MPLDTLSASVVGSGFRLVLPGRTPTKGNRPTPIRPGLVLPSKQYRRWIKATETAALTLWARLVRLGARLPCSAPIAVTVAVYLPSRQRGDEDNYKKAIGDWLQKNTFVANDQLIHWGEFHIFVDKLAPRLELTVEQYEMKPGEI